MNKKAFTLLELMVVIAIIGIMVIGIGKIDFKAISDKQRLSRFFYQVKTNIETIENNALIGKNINIGTISPNLIVPEYWQIDINNRSNGIVVIKYYDGVSLKNYSKIIPQKFYYIKVYNDGDLIPNTETGSIKIQGSEFSLESPSSTDKILKVVIGYKNFTGALDINTISGVIEEE